MGNTGKNLVYLKLESKRNSSDKGNKMEDFVSLFRKSPFYGWKRIFSGASSSFREKKVDEKAGS